MTLRRRLAATLVATAVPCALGMAWVRNELHRRAGEQALRDLVQARLQTIGQERCETDPAALGPPAFARGPGPGRPPLGLGPPPLPPHDHPPEAPHRHLPAPPHGRGGGPRGRMEPRRLDLFAYDASFRSADPQAPALPARVRAALEHGDAWALDRRERAPGPAEVLLAQRTGWGGGCAFVVARRLDPPAPPLPEHLGVLGGLVLVLVGAVVVAAGPAVRRIRALAADVRRSAASHYAEEVPVRGRDEVSDLARAFNEAGREVRARVVRLEEREAALRAFVADSTHDLMLPLTVLQGHLDTLRRAAEAGAPAARDVVLGAEEEAHYMASLVHNLGAAAKLEAGAPAAQAEPVDLGRLVERVVLRHQPVAGPRGVSVEHSVPEAPLVVAGDVTLLEQAVSNVVHNAVRYNRPQGHVAVVLETAVSEGAPSFVLLVVDDGPGVPEDELPRLGERSFRGDRARQRTPDGRGLGLSIAREVARRHGFTLRFERSGYGGLQVELRGPLAAAGQGSPDAPPSTGTAAGTSPGDSTGRPSR